MKWWIKKLAYLLVFLVGFGLFFYHIGFLGSNERASKSVDEYMEVVSSIRKLNFEENVPAVKLKRSEFRNYMDNRMEEERDTDWTESDKTLKAFGLIPENLNWKKTVVEYQESQTAGFYDSEKNQFYVVKNGGERNRNFTIAHELTHALQDQIFGLETLPTDAENNDDPVLAVDSLVEGGAYYVSLEYKFQKNRKHLIQVFDSLENRLERFLNTTDTLGDENFPLILEKIQLFPYLAGLRFTVHGIENGWKRINRAYSDPPTSTEQILHPEKYFENRDNPTIITLPSLSRTLEKDWKLQENNTFGEYAVGVLFLKFFKGPENVEKNISARTGWDGDSYLTYYSKKDNKTAIAWMSTWDTKENATQFYNRYRKLLGEKYSNEDIVRENRTYLQMKTNDGRALLERRKSDVLVLERIHSEKLDKISHLVWTQRKKKTLENAYDY